MVALLPSLLALLVMVPVPAPTLRQLLEANPADSLVAPLLRFEDAHHGSDAAEAAFTLGQLHYARGEYRQAADAFARAAARFAPARKGEARYWAGLAWLGCGEANQARAAFEEAARQVTPRPPEALLGVALCWELAQRPDRALETLQGLLVDDPGEAGPAALDHLAMLNERLGRPEPARRAREQLVREYPRSLEAARAGQAATAQPRSAPQPPRAPAPVAPLAPRRVAPPPPAAQIPLTVQIGAFRDQGRAQQLAAAARRQGFTPVRVSALQDPGGALYAVRVGVFATAEDARGAGVRLGRALGVTWRVVPAP
jgi:tetratricopeptide (TPR) repeat protein